VRFINSSPATAFDYDEDGKCEAITFMAKIGDHKTCTSGSNRIRAARCRRLKAIRTFRHATSLGSRPGAPAGETKRIGRRSAGEEASAERAAGAALPRYGMTDTSETVHERLQLNRTLLTD